MCCGPLTFTPMNKAFLLFFTCFAFSCYLSAQQPSQASTEIVLSGAISGELIDSITRQTLEFASVGVFDAKTQQVINGSISDARGMFRIGELPNG